MPKASLSIEIPDDAWVSAVSRRYPHATFRVLSAFASEAGGVGVVEVEAPGGTEDILSDISSHSVIKGTEVLWQEGNEALIEFETRKPMMLLAARRSNLPVRMPFEIQDGVGNWELTTSRERLSELDSVFESMGIGYELEYVHEAEPEELLTDKQRNVIETALRMGYYDTPRESSLSEVAERVGIAKSTCSEILHRAEEKVVKDLLG